MTYELRALRPEDLDAVFAWESDPAGIALAAFTRADPSRAAFDAHYARIMPRPDVTLMLLTDDGVPAATVGSFAIDGVRELAYWVDPARWGQGLAGRAVAAFLPLEPARPLFAHVAAHNAGSIRVLERAGFTRIGSETGYSDALGREVAEHVYRLER